MSQQDPNEIIEKAKDFFRSEIAASHLRNTNELKKGLKKFNLNPFLHKYKANFLTGNDDPLSMAKALVYPRILGASIDTTFGNQLQRFCSEVLEGFASVVPGLDIEFIDKTDGRKKYCQIKSGPNTINSPDVETIIGKFRGIKNLARQNRLDVRNDDLVVGVFYGTPKELSNNYKKIDEEHPVFVGTEFWYRLTGEEDFYKRITDAIGEVAKEFDASKLIDEIIHSLAEEIKAELKQETADED